MSLRKPGRINVAKPLYPVRWKDGDRYGVEIEIEGARLPRENHVYDRCNSGEYRWMTHQDGSLRGESCEYVFEQGTPLKNSLELVEKLFAEFNAYGSRLVPSNRTSAHVHMNVTGLKINAINAIVALWFTFEEAVINCCGEFRKNNHFCLTAKESSAIVRAWERAVETGNYKFSNEYKYAALNFAALNRFGTLEFRCFPMPTKAADINKWIKFLHGLKQVAIENYLDNTKIGRDLSEKGPTAILQEICAAGGCPELVDEFVRNNTLLRDSTIHGFRNIQETVFSYDWPELVDECNKTFVENPFGEREMMAAPPIRPPVARRRANAIPDIPDIPQPPGFDAAVQEEMRRIRERMRAVRPADWDVIRPPAPR